MRQVLFLTLAEVIEIHADQIERYGGQKGIRDINLLSSALAMPQASFEGRTWPTQLPRVPLVQVCVPALQGPTPAVPAGPE